MPAAAVIPAPPAYVNVVVFKTLVVERRTGRQRCRAGVCTPSAGVSRRRPRQVIGATRAVRIAAREVKFVDRC